MMDLLSEQWDSTAAKVQNFLTLLKGSPVPGLLVVENVGMFNPVRKMVRSAGYNECLSWQKALRNLRLRPRVSLLLTLHFSKQHYDFLAQYRHQRGLMQIIERPSLRIRSQSYDPSLARLLLVSTAGMLSLVEKSYSITEHVGVIERI